MIKTFAVKAQSFSLYKAIKEEAEKLGWVYYDDFVEFEEKSMERCNCLYFSTEWPDYNNEFLFSFSNHESTDKRFYLAADWNEVIEHMKALNPAKGAVNYNMKDPGSKQPDELKAEQSEAATEQAQESASEAVATEATTESAEEGGVQG